MARPRKNEEIKHTDSVRLRLTAEDRLALEKAAEATGLSMSSYLRNLLKRRVVVAKSARQANAEAVTALLRLGNNLNQIARRFNMHADTHFDRQALDDLIGRINATMDRLET